VEFVLRLWRVAVLQVTCSSVGRIGIAVAGASCSGKTTLANALASELDATLLRIDDYYRPLDHLTYEPTVRGELRPPLGDRFLPVGSQVRLLIHGIAVEAPSYDFTRHTRFAGCRVVTPSQAIIIDGLFALAYPDLAELCDVRVFVDAPHNVCMERRLVRDTTERGRTHEEVVHRFSSHVWPMYERHVQPSASRSTVRVSGVQELGRSLRQVLDEVRILARA